MISAEEWECLFVEKMGEVYIDNEATVTLDINGLSCGSYHVTSINTGDTGWSNKETRYLNLNVQLDNSKYDGSVITLYLDTYTMFNLTSNWSIKLNNLDISDYYVKCLTYTTDSNYTGYLSSFKLVFDYTNTTIHIVNTVGCMAIAQNAPGWMS